VLEAAVPLGSEEVVQPPVQQLVVDLLRVVSQRLSFVLLRAEFVAEGARGLDDLVRGRRALE
tara:strand:+ start:1056 stop:1241 length:186 start_codon:yes stop_codon:yes gene_type:complete